MLTGTQNQINATLANANGVRFFNTADYNGTGTLTVTTNDQGHTGSGGPLTDVDTITITITPVADIANDTATFAEDTGSPASILVQANDTFETPATRSPQRPTGRTAPSPSTTTAPPSISPTTSSFIPSRPISTAPTASPTR